MKRLIHTKLNILLLQSLFIFQFINIAHSRLTTSLRMIVLSHPAQTRNRFSVTGNLASVNTLQCTAAFPFLQCCP